MQAAGFPLSRGRQDLLAQRAKVYTLLRRDQRSSDAEATIIGKLTTHVLDTAHGCPAAGISVSLHRLDGDRMETLAQVVLNADGRAPAPLLEGEAFKVGRYRLVFEIAAYFRSREVTLAEPPFLNHVPIEFAIADTSTNYHVPLLVTPWSYSTYRGS